MGEKKGATPKRQRTHTSASRRQQAERSQRFREKVKEEQQNTRESIALLQQSVQDLVRENIRLRSIIRNLPLPVTTSVEVWLPITRLNLSKHPMSN